jgi:hypothetical protein
MMSVMTSRVASGVGRVQTRLLLIFFLCLVLLVLMFQSVGSLGKVSNMNTKRFL